MSTGASGPIGPTGIKGVNNIQQIRNPQFPPNMTQAISFYRILSNEYSAVTDPTVKAAYKTVLDAKYAEITTNLNSYTTSIQSFLSSIKMTT